MNNDDRPVLTQINLVVRNMTAAVDFYRRLGVEIAPYDAFWGARYVVVADPDGTSVRIMSAVDPKRRT